MCWLLQALNFHTTLVGRHGEVVADSSTIRRKYMKGWFVIDLLSCIPDELFTLLFDVFARHTVVGQAHVVQLLGALKVLRLLRLGRVVRKVDMYLEFGGAVLLLLVVVFMLFAHWMACIWFSIGLYDISRNITYGALPIICPFRHLRVHLLLVLLPSQSIAHCACASASAGWVWATANHTMVGVQVEGGELVSPNNLMCYLTALYFTVSCITSVGFGNVSVAPA